MRLECPSIWDMQNFGGLLVLFYLALPAAHSWGSQSSGLSSATSAKTLVVYNVLGADAASASNLDFFLRHGVHVNDTRAHFVFVQSGAGRTARHLPS